MDTSTHTLSQEEAAAIAAARAAAYAEPSHKRIVTGWDTEADEATYKDGQQHRPDAMPAAILEDATKAPFSDGCTYVVEVEYNRHGNRAIYGVRPDARAILYAN
jgi:hypothetical protein